MFFKVTYRHKRAVKTYIVCETNLYPLNLRKDFALGNSLFGAVNLTKNADPYKHKSFGYSISAQYLQ